MPLKSTDETWSAANVTFLFALRAVVGRLAALPNFAVADADAFDCLLD